MSFINISKRGLKFSEKSLFEIDIVFDEKVTFGGHLQIAQKEVQILQNRPNPGPKGM